MTKRLLLALLLWLSATAAFAQTTTTFNAVVGQPLIAEVDLPSEAVGQTGITAQLKFFVDGSYQPSVVYGAPSGASRTVQFAIPPTPISTAKTYLLSIALSYTITDQTKWSCGSAGIGTVTPGGLVCPDVFGTNNVSLVLAPPPTPLPNPKPTNFRLMLKPTVVGGDELGFDIELTLDDGSVVTRFVPVAFKRTGAFLNSLTLAPSAIIER